MKFNKTLLTISLLFFIFCLTISPFSLIFYEKKDTRIKKKIENISVPLEQENAIEPLILKLQSRLDPIVSRTISNTIIKYSTKFQFPPELIISVINRESRFNPLATSKKGAAGLMQIMAKVHKDKLKKLNIIPSEVYYIDHNIHLGCWILREYYDRTQSIEKALFKYVGGKEQKYVNDILRDLATVLIEGSMRGKENDNR